MTGFQKPPPIEDLSQISWKRVEQGLNSKLDTEDQTAFAALGERNRRPWFAAGGAAIAVAAIAFFALWGSDKSSKQPTIASNLSEIRTQESSTEFVVAGTRLEVSPHSAVGIAQHGDALALDLREGGVRLEVALRDHRSPVILVSGDVQIEVVSTEFAVYRSAGQTQVVVYQGLVAVTRNGQRELVHAGEEWPKSEELAKAQKRSAKQHHATKAHKPKHERDERSLFEAAADKELSAPAEAIRLYGKAAHGTGPWAANALYAQARLLLSQGNDSRARKLLTRYGERFPSGPNAADAEALLQDMN